jgi:hypothetical protein
MAKKDKDKDKDKKGKDEPPVDLAARIGARGADAPAPVPPPPPAPPASRTDTPLPPRYDGPLPPRRTAEPREPSAQRPMTIGGDEPTPPPLVVAADAADEAKGAEKRSAAIPSPRTPPGPGETDVVITPLPTLDDWHRFELALRRVRGVGQVRTEYYRHGVLKVRVSYEGTERLAQALRAGVPGYRVRVIGEDRTTLQILVSTENEERRPG